jgi:protein TonB
VLTRSALPRPALVAGGETLPPAARRAAIAVVVTLHVLAAFALLQMGAVREAVRQSAPIFATLIDAPVAAPAPAPAERTPVPPRPVARPVAPPPLIAAAPSATPVAVETPLTPPEAVIAPSAPPAAPTPPVAAAPAAAPASAPPRTLSATEVGFIDPPRPAYPPLSRKAGEQGRVLLRVLVDEAGRPAQVLLSQSSGHARLDEAAAAAVRRARFRPPTDNGAVRSVWVLLPISFTLDS